MRKMSVNGCLYTILDLLKTEAEDCIYGISDRVYVFSGIHSKLDNEFCARQNLIVIPTPNDGGTIVTGKGDIDIGFFSKDVHNTFNDEFAKCLIDYLVARGLDASLAKNDIVIDTIYKVGSHSRVQYGPILYSAFHISINVDLELIKAVCMKPMKKIPKGLSDYGITSEEMEQLFLKFADNYFKRTK